VFAVRDATGEVVDLAALDLTSGALATWRGRAAMLGEDYVLRPRFGPLPVYTTAVEWLCDARGVFIIDAKRAAPVLELHTLATVDRRAGIALRAALAKGTRRPLKIMIPFSSAIATGSCFQCTKSGETAWPQLICPHWSPNGLY